jgi:hypothetical protein
MSLSDKQDGFLESAGWQFGSKLRTEHVWDAFVLITLLRDCEGRGRQLEVPHTGLQKNRFTTAMEERNLRIIQNGQDEIDHTCQTCTRTFEEISIDGTKTIRIISSLISMLIRLLTTGYLPTRICSTCHDGWSYPWTSTMCCAYMP